MVHRGILRVLSFLFLSFPVMAEEVTSDETKSSQASDEDGDSKRSDDKKKERVKFEGFVRSYFAADNFKNGEVFHEGRLQMKSRRRQGLRASLEVDFRTKTDDIQVNEAYLDKKFDSGLRMKAGYDLKRFGLEYEESRLERATIERSLIYRRLDIFTYTGRETVLRFERGSDDQLNQDWSLAASFSEAENASLIANWQTAWDSIDARYGVWMQIGSDKTEEGGQVVGAMMHSLWQRRFDKFWQLEWVSGIDPNQSEYEALFDDDERIYFTGVNGLYGHSIYHADDEMLSLMGGLSGLIHDVSEADYNTLGSLVGLRYDLGSLRLSFNVELIGTNSLVDTQKRSFNESSARLEALYAF